MAYGLLQAGRQTKQNAASSVQSLAQAEQSRELTNKQLKTQHKNQVIGMAGTGATIGSAFGPIGTVAGGVIGGLVGAFM